jgi:ATP-dependent Lhr-like helicase
VESRESPDKPLDVLVQHLVTVALGSGAAGQPARSGFDADALFDEVRGAYAYRALAARGVRLGAGLRRVRRRQPGRYPEYHRMVRARTAAGA